MPLVTWNAQYKIGVPLIDDQHSGIFEALNRLHEALRSAQSRTVIADGIRSLVDQARIHFRDEELHMAAIGFPGRFTHADEHAALLKQIVAYQDQYLANSNPVSAEALTVFLVDWAMHHVLGLDKEYAKATLKAHSTRSRPMQPGAEVRTGA